MARAQYLSSLSNWQQLKPDQQHTQEEQHDPGEPNTLVDHAADGPNDDGPALVVDLDENGPPYPGEG